MNYGFVYSIHLIIDSEDALKYVLVMATPC